MEENKIKHILFASLFLSTILIFSFLLGDQIDENQFRNNIIADIDEATNYSLIHENNDDNIIIHGKFAGMLDAEFYQNSTKISISEIAH